MTAEWTTLALLALATTAVSWTVTRGAIFEDFRAWVAARSAFFEDLTSCPFCFSVWCAVAFVAAFRPHVVRCGWGSSAGTWTACVAHVAGLGLDGFTEAMALVAVASLIFRALARPRTETTDGGTNHGP